MPSSQISLPMDHIGIAVNDIERSTEKYVQLLQATVIHDEQVPSQGVSVRFLHVGGETKIELLQALDESSPVRKFIDKRGEGLHHIAFKTDDIYFEFERLKAAGLQLLQAEPVIGANNKLIFFIHPKSMGGTLVEICQPR